MTKGIIFVGEFNNNKNALRLAKTVINLSSEIPDICLHLVGQGGVQEDRLKQLSKEYPNIIIFHGSVTDKSQLRELYCQCSVFAMPSYSETFGLVYLEALSQNLAVIYSKGQAIDGMFPPTVGEAVIPNSTESIIDALRKILTHREDYSNQGVDFGQFRWKEIAVRYLNLFKKDLNKH